MVRSRMAKARRDFEQICLSISDRNRAILPLIGYKVSWKGRMRYPEVEYREESQEEKQVKRRVALERKLVGLFAALQGRYTALKMRELHADAQGS